MAATILPALAFLVAALLPGTVAAMTVDEDRDRPEREPKWAWYLPDQLKLQLAGNIGFLSPGVGYAWFDHALEADVFVGHVPESMGGPVTSITSKLTVRPFRFEAGPVEFRLPTLSLQLSYTFGDGFFLKQPNYYPSGYYALPSALHADLGLGTSISWKTRRAGRRGIYAELSSSDRAIYSWAKNRHYLSVSEVVSVALGVFGQFEG